MIFSPNVWGHFYIIQLLLLSLALGSWAVHQPRWLMVPRLSRFLIGFCITPFMLGIWMLFLAAILPGAPKWLFLLPPPTLAFILLGLYGPRTLRRLSRDYQRVWQTSKNSWPAYLIYLGAALILALVIHKLLLNGQPPIIAYDASGYLAEALPFVQKRSLSATTGFRDWPDGTIRGSVHNFLWPAFLSHALMTTGNNPPGYPYDHAARAAFQITIIYMLLSVVALAGIAKRPGIGALTLILLLQVPQFEYISSNDSRDAFRIIPLLLLTTTLIGVSPPRLNLKLRPMSLLPPLILAAFCLSGHTLGGVIAAVIVLAWLIWSIIHKAHWLNLLLILVAIGIGLLFSGSHYIEAYLETGNFRGTSRSIISLVEISPNEIILPERHRIAAEATITQRLVILLERDRYRLSVPGVLGAIFAITWWTKLRQQRHSQFVPFIGLIVLTVSLPFIGLLDYKNYELSKWFISNIRYPLHWYPFAAVCVATVAWYWYIQFMSGDNRYVKTLANAAFVLLVSVATFSAYQTITFEWPTEPVNDREKQLFENLDPLKTTIQQLPAGKRLLLDDSRYNYYLGNQAVLMYSRPTWGVIQAKNEDEVQDALRKLNIGVVVLREDHIAGWWDQTPLFSFLNNPKNAFESVRTVYIIDEELVRQQRKLDETATREAREAIILNLDPSKVVIEDGAAYAIANTGEKAKIEGSGQVVDGPTTNWQALALTEGISVTSSTPVIDLGQGSLSIWARLTHPKKQPFTALIRVNQGASLDLYIYHQGENGYLKIFYKEFSFPATKWAIRDDRWHHYLFTWQDGEQKFYIDSFLATSAETEAGTTKAETFKIGEHGNISVANLITFNRPLSRDEVVALYRTGLSMK